MKRQKESGAAWRKKKKIREEAQKNNEGAILKFMSQESKITISSTTNPTVGVYENENMPATSTAVEFTYQDQATSISSVITAATDKKDDQAIASTAVEYTALGRFESEVNKPSSDSASSENEHMEVMEQTNCSIDLKDVGQWPSKINDNTRVLLVRQGPFVAQHLDADFGEVIRSGTSVKGQARKLTREWFFQTLPNGEKMLRSWMMYSPSKKSVYCFSCKLFSNESYSHFDSINGFNLWWKLNPKIHEHESSSVHIRNFMAWKEMEIRIRHEATIDKAEQTVLETEVKKWRDILSRFLDIIIFLAKQNLALRGHREGAAENRGNFLELVDLLAKYDPVLREHVLRIKMKKKLLFLTCLQLFRMNLLKF